MTEKLRKTGIDVVGDVPWGTHFCQFYDTKEDLIDTLLPYFKTGLESNEFCMWVVSEPLNEKEAEKRLRESVPDFDRYVKRGQIEIVPHDRWYLKQGVFDMQRVFDGWLDKLNQCLDRGYEGMRVTGNTAWLEEKDWKDFAQYEEEVNKVIGQYRMLAICTYPLHKCSAYEIIDVVSKHRFALIRRGGTWESLESSDRKKLEKQLRNSEQKYSTLLQSSADGILVADIQTREFRYTNPAICRMLGRSREELISMRVDDIHPKESLEHVISEFEAQARGQKLLAPDIPCLRKDGTIVYADINTVKVLVDGKECNIGVFRDITERKQMERQLQAEKKKLEDIMAIMADSVCLTDLDANILMINDTMQELFGIPREKFLTMNGFELVTKDDMPMVSEAMQDLIKTGLPQSLEVTGKLGGAKGRQFWMKFSPVKDVKGQPTGIVTVARDITESKKVQEKLRDYREQLRSLASELVLGEERTRRRLATDLHDHIGQSLVLIKMKLDALRHSASSTDLAEKLEQISESVEKMLHDTRSLVFDLSPPILYELGFEPAVRWLTKRSRDRDGIAARFEDDGQPKPLDDEVRIGLFRAVGELLVNVAKHAQAKNVRVHTRRDGPNIRVLVEDDGVGFNPAEVQSQGDISAGFGLFMLRERLDHFGGSFQLQSEPGRGTRATLVAPLKSEQTHLSGEANEH